MGASGRLVAMTMENGEILWEHNTTKFRAEGLLWLAVRCLGEQGHRQYRRTLEVSWH